MSAPKSVRFSPIERHNSPAIIPTLHQRLERGASRRRVKDARKQDARKQ